MTAYVLGRRLDSLLAGSSIEQIREYPCLLSFTLSEAPFRFMKIFRVGVRSALVLTDSPPPPSSYSIPIFKQAWGGMITGAGSLGIDRIIVLRTREESGWESATPYIFRLDFITPAAPVSLFGAGSGQLVAVSGSISGRKSLEPDSRPRSAPYSLLALPEKAPESMAGGKALIGLVEGLDPVAAEVISAHCGTDRKALWEYLRGLLPALHSQEGQWYLYRYRKRTVIYPVPLPFPEPPLETGSYRRVMEKHFDETVYPEFIDLLRKRAGSNIRSRAKKLRRLIRNLDRD
ncbi:MAG: hypothetical protein GF417_00070, partial [Candidatus Latescibacteria bacterium]|nr:hypothetical protein [bacterium]MBD3422823.1 hypothetical protein [Candidatus Latescibacterota bacterium]